MSGYENMRVLAVGLGESGKAAARFFASRGARVTATDTRPAAELTDTIAELRSQGVELRLGSHSEELFLEQDWIVPSPGVPWDLPQLESARKEGIRVAGELEAASGELAGRVVGVTGTNGKTTTTALIGHIFEAAGLTVQVAGNIGTPVLDIVDTSTPDTWNILELSSFQLEAMQSFRCDIAAVLNVTPDHLDRHHDFASYAAAKARIFKPQRAEDRAVLNAEDGACVEYARTLRSQPVWFSRTRQLERGAWVADGRVVVNGRPIADLDLPIRGAHNLENALAAAAVAVEAGVPDERIASGLESFRPVEHRLEFVRRRRGVDYYNDSKATNVDAAIKAIESFDGGVWWILGGRDKDGDYRRLADLLAGRVRGVMLIGEAAAKIREQLESEPEPIGDDILCDCKTLAAALSHSAHRAEPGDTVLLSPACASFDQFRNYGERGHEFKRLVSALEQ